MRKTQPGVKSLILLVGNFLTWMKIKDSVVKRCLSDWFSEVGGANHKLADQTQQLPVVASLFDIVN